MSNEASEIERKAKRALWIIERAAPATIAAFKQRTPTVWAGMIQDLKAFETQQLTRR